MTGDLTGAGWYFSASHFDTVRAELHGHSYEVMAWWPAEPPRDAVVLQAMVKRVVGAFDHTTLAPEMSRAEALAAAIMHLLPECVGVDISRPVERFAVQVLA